MNTDHLTNEVRLVTDKEFGKMYVPLKLFPGNKWNYEIKLTFGLKEITVNLLPEENTDYITLSRDIFNSLGLSENMKICAKVENDELKLGPVVGVFMNEYAVDRLRKNKANNKMHEMAKAARRLGVAVYFFTVNDVIWTENMINAVFYNSETTSWENKKFPFPNVLYDRGGGFKRKSKPKARSLRKQLDKVPNLLKINAQHYFDKWKLHAQLSKHEAMSIYLPETIRFDYTITGLEEMLNKYPDVYLKARTGSNGRQIIRVRKKSPTLYEYTYFKKKIVQGTTKSLNELIRIAINFMKYRSFIIQQGLDVLTYQDSKIDIRVLLQRDGKGEWQITSMPVRVANGDCPVTSTKSGSSVYPFDDAFENILKYPEEKLNDIKSKIIDLAFAAINNLEKEYGIFGEVGIDVAIDKNQKVWFIESNAKPAKDTIIIAGPKEAIKKSFNRPFEYAGFLTGFINQFPEDDVEEIETPEED